ncbi:hypothetical protein V6Z11_A13G247400 [Gossypium hirsutum]
MELKINRQKQLDHFNNISLFSESSLPLKAELFISAEKTLAPTLGAAVRYLHRMLRFDPFHSRKVKR